MAEGGCAPPSDWETLDPSHLLFVLLPDPWDKRSEDGSFYGPDQEVAPIPSVHMKFSGTQDV